MIRRNPRLTLTPNQRRIQHLTPCPRLNQSQSRNPTQRRSRGRILNPTRPRIQSHHHRHRIQGPPPRLRRFPIPTGWKVQDVDPSDNLQTILETVAPQTVLALGPGKYFRPDPKRPGVGRQFWLGRGSQNDGRVLRDVVIRPRNVGDHVEILNGFTYGQIAEGPRNLRLTALDIYVPGLAMKSDAERFVNVPNSSQSYNDFGLSWGGIQLSECDGVIISYCTIHDNAQGLSLWANAKNVLVENNHIHNNGWADQGRKHGHAIYGQSAPGAKKTITGNLIDNRWGLSAQIYGSSKAPINDVDFIRNVCVGDPDNAGTHRVLLGGKGQNQNIRAIDNVLLGCNLQLGYAGSGVNGGQCMGNRFTGTRAGVVQSGPMTNFQIVDNGPAVAAKYVRGLWEVTVKADETHTIKKK